MRYGKEGQGRTGETVGVKIKQKRQKTEQQGYKLKIKVLNSCKIKNKSFKCL